MLPLLPVPVGRLCSHFRPRSRALLARMTFRTRWCATTALTARTAATRASVTSHAVTRSHSLTVATGRYAVRLSSWVSVSLFVRLPVYSPVFLGLSLCPSSACLLSACLSSFQSVCLSVCLSVCESACLFSCTLIRVLIQLGLVPERVVHLLINSSFFVDFVLVL